MVWSHSSVCPSVHLFVTPFSLCFCHCIIMKFSVITIGKSNLRPYKSSESKVKVTEVKTNFTPNLVISWPWHRWLRSYAQSLKLQIYGCPIAFWGHLSNFKVIWAGKSMILTHIERFRTVTPVWIHRWTRNDAQSLKEHGRGALLSHPGIPGWLCFCNGSYAAGRRYLFMR